MVQLNVSENRRRSLVTTALVVAVFACLLLLAGSVSAAPPQAERFVTSGAPAAPMSYICTNDVDGVNDIPGQKDLTQLCIDYASTDPILVTWNWDAISGSGANTIDGCALFDTNGNGLVDYAVCNSWVGNQAQTAGYPIVYSCNDTKPYNCAGDTPIALNGTACTIANATDDPFPGGTAHPNDTKSSCTVPLAAVGGTSATLLNVCSYTSASPSSNAGDCVLTSTSRGNLTVLKNVVPDDPTTNWNIAVTGTTGATTFNDTLIGDDTTGNVLVNAATYSIVETAGTGTSFAGYVTTWACTKDGNPLSSGTGTSITGVGIANGDVVNCVFTNSTSIITVNKVTDPPNAGHVFDFTISPAADTNQPSGFTLTDLQTPISIKVKPGTYSVTETGDQGWWLEAPTGCVYSGTSTPVGTSPTLPGASGNGGSVTGITIAAGETIDCTFTNKVGPTAVTLASFSATAQASGVQVDWETAQETQNQGFNLWRGTSPAGPDVRLNAAIIPSQNPGGTIGASYQYLDTYQLTSGTTYYYWLEDVSLSGTVTRHEPVSVPYNVPTAVRLAGPRAAGGLPLVWPLAGVALLALGAAALIRRRTA